MANIFGNKTQSKTKLQVIRFFSDLHNELQTYEKTVKSLKKSFEHLYNRSLETDESNVKGIYSQLIEYAEAAEVYVKNVTPKINQIYTQVELLERNSKEYAVYSEIAKKCQTIFNSIAQIKTQMYSELDSFYDDYQGILVS